MSQDARFEEGAERPLYLQAVTEEDLQVLSTLLQDAVFPVTEIAWRPGAREFALLLNRFRWEDRDAAERRGRPYERVQTVLRVGDVKKVSSQGIDRNDKDTILSLLTIAFEPGEDGTGRIVLTLAGDGAIALDVECIDATIKDVTRPYIAPSRQAPSHGQE